MSGLFASYADKAGAAVERNRAALERSRRLLAEHDAAKPDGDDSDALYGWKRERRDLEDRVESDGEALALSETKAAEAAAREAAANLDRRGEAQETASAKLAARIGKDWPKAAQTLIDLITAMEEDHAAVQRLSREMADAGQACRVVPAEHRVHRAGAWGGLSLIEAQIPMLKQ